MLPFPKYYNLNCAFFNNIVFENLFWSYLRGEIMEILLIIGIFVLWGWLCISQKNSHLKVKNNNHRSQKNIYDEDFEKHFIIVEEAVKLEKKEDEERVYEKVKEYSKLIQKSKKIKEENEKNKVDEIIRYSIKQKTLKDRVYECYKNNLDKSFKDKLLYIIDSKNLNDSDVYKKANISRQVFNNIINVKGYKPERNTIFRLILALELSVEDAEDLLKSLGYSFSNYWLEDIYVKLCLENNFYNVNEIFKELNSMNHEEYLKTTNKKMSNEN